MTVAHIIEIFRMLLITLAIAGMIGMILSSMFHNNRLLFWCMMVALGTHFGVGGGLWFAGYLAAHAQAAKPPEIRLAMAQPPPPPPPPEPKKEEVHDISKPLGKINGDKTVTKIRKGTNMDPHAQPGAKGAKTFGNHQTMSSPTSDPSQASVEFNPDARSSEYLGPGDSLDVKDLNKVGRVGGGGDDWGDPNGDPNGGVPVGFPDGTVGGKVYFIRLKHGSGAWYAWNNGTQRLLHYLNQAQGLPCQTETWPMTTAELKKKYMSKGGIPSFLYLYVDSTFALTSGDVTVLREYMDKGGFLFLDSRCDPDIKDRVAHEMDKVLPGTRLSTISRSHPINNFLFALSDPGLGENPQAQSNFGISRNGRLVVFYTMGNFSHLYESHDPNEFPYVTAQYQMGANVMLYALTKGDATGVARKKGASAKITTAALEKLGLLSPSPSSSSTTTPGGAPTESVKVPRKPIAGQPDSPDAPPPDPDEIKVIE